MLDGRYSEQGHVPCLAVFMRVSQRYVYAGPGVPCSRPCLPLTTMSLSQELDAVLLRARHEGLLKTPSVLLSQVLHALCRERSQPLDPDYVSEPACRRLLSTHPEVLTSLETAVETGIQEDLWNNRMLSSVSFTL